MPYMIEVRQHYRAGHCFPSHHRAMFTSPSHLLGQAETKRQLAIASGQTVHLPTSPRHLCRCFLVNPSMLGIGPRRQCHIRGIGKRSDASARPSCADWLFQLRFQILTSWRRSACDDSLLSPPIPPLIAQLCDCVTERTLSFTFLWSDDLQTACSNALCTVEPAASMPCKTSRQACDCDTRIMATPIAQPNVPRSAPQRKLFVARMAGPCLLLAIMISLIQPKLWAGHNSATPVPGVDGGLIPEGARSQIRPDLSPRDDSPTDVCFRWAQQGQATTDSSQTDNTWNNDFLLLDLTKTWQIASPALTGLPQPSGPPNVSLGYLWNSYDSLYLYGGEFSWKPVVSPSPLALWEYSIDAQSWIEHSNPQTSSGRNAPNQDPVQRAAEGAGASVPSLGRAFYFGGHLDGLYLQSLLEFTFPGYSNNQVDTLPEKAGTDGTYRNVTEGGLQSSAGFTERADGLLIYIPGFGDQGILLALAGGTNESYTQMNNVDVYDIAESTWYKQSTSGPMPDVRVNPCAVTAAAPDGSSYQIHLWGGQALLPYGNQTQYNDMWILSLPSFTWILVDQSGQAVPYGRSGHSCSVWDGQMISVGGYVGDAQLTCESPGVYVFDLSALQWVQQFTAYSTASNGSSPSSGTNSVSNPLNQQPAQLANGTNAGGLEGSYNYTVPEAVISVIGGGPSGGATLTAPVVTASAGPLATGSAITYVVTQSGGAVVTETASPTNSPSSGSAHEGPNIAAIVVGVICGILFIVACYLAFCAYIYRKQLQLYKRHNEMAQRRANNDDLVPIPGLLAAGRSSKGSSGHHEGPSPFWMRNDSHSQAGSTDRSGRHIDAGSVGGSHRIVGADGYQNLRRSSDHSSVGDLMADQEPSFVGVMLNPRRTLRVINRD
nr:kelch repeat-containing protein [Quercus suber]